MGETETTVGSYSVALPAHSVTIPKAFYVSKTPCTQAQWLALMGSNPSSFCTTNGSPDDDLTRPVEKVSFDMITTATTGFLDVLNGAATTRPASSTFRLPTEAEFEFACRAGSSTSYYFGAYDSGIPADVAIIETYGWFDGNSKIAPYTLTGSTHGVAQKLPNAWGLYDMIGSVWQVCEDDYHAAYDVTGAGVSVRPDDGTAWVDSPTRAIERSYRGGSFDLGAHNGQSKFRGPYDHDFFDWNTGFRVVLQLP
jgi:formylglycine-generating enzyme required for sulfatase activity